MTSVTMTINMDFEDFDDHYENLVRHALAGLLRISPGSVKIQSKKHKSVEIDIELPDESAKELVRKYQRRDSELLSALECFNIIDIRIGGGSQKSNRLGADSVTQLLQEWSEGDPEALGRLFPLVIDQLRQIARRISARESTRYSIQTTDLVNELYLRLLRLPEARWTGRAQFVAFSAKVMMRILVEHARSASRQKRAVSLDKVEIGGAGQVVAVEILDLERALRRLESADPKASEIVRLRVFAGLDVSEIAELLGLQPSSVKIDYQMGHAWLLRQFRKP